MEPEPRDMRYCLISVCRDAKFGPIDIDHSQDRATDFEKNVFQENSSVKRRMLQPDTRKIPSNSNLNTRRGECRSNDFDLRKLPECGALVEAD